MAAIDKALTQAQEALNKAVEELQSKSAELEDKAKTELDKILEPLRIKLDDLIAQANDKGKTTLPQKKTRKKLKTKKVWTCPSVRNTWTISREPQTTWCTISWTVSTNN